MRRRASISTKNLFRLILKKTREIPRDWSGADMVRALQKLGFVKDHQVGSHVRMVKGTLRATVPMHTPIPVGTFQSILKQAAVTLEEVLDA